MIDYVYKDLYNQDSVEKQITIAFKGGEITNTELYSENFELKESLCSEEELRFGSCEASVLKFKIANTVEALKNKILTVSEVLDENTDIPFQFGKYKVYSDAPSGDRNYRNITAYDFMYDIINADVAQWYSSLEFPLTLKEFRDSFFVYFEIEQEEVELILDSMAVEKTIETTSISGKDIITAICELNGVFGHINRQGKFEYISLEQKQGYLHPSINLFPNEIYPNQIAEKGYVSNEIAAGVYQSCEYEDFETGYISKLQIRQEENDVGAIYGNGDNCYIVEDNFLIYGKSSEELFDICVRLFGKISGISYRPFKATAKGNPCYTVGDMVKLHTRTKDVEGYILQRTLKGIQSLKDTYEAKGVLEYEEKVNSVQKDIKQLKGKTNALIRSVEETKSLITDEENGLQTQVKQNAEKIETKVTKGSVSSHISQEADKITIVGNRLIVKSDNFTLDEEGNLNISGKYEVEYIRTMNAEDYTEEDCERIQNIITKQLEATEEDLKKYDLKGTGIDGQCYLTIIRLVRGYDEWRKIRYKITIDPSENTALIKTKLSWWSSSNEEEVDIGSIEIGGMGIRANEFFTNAINADKYQTFSEDGIERYGATGDFVLADGTHIYVTNGIVTGIF